MRFSTFIFCYWQNWLAACLKHATSCPPSPCSRLFPYCQDSFFFQGLHSVKSFGLTELLRAHFCFTTFLLELLSTRHLALSPRITVFLSIISRTSSAFLPHSPNHRASALSVKQLVTTAAYGGVSLEHQFVSDLWDKESLVSRKFNSRKFSFLWKFILYSQHAYL